MQVKRAQQPHKFSGIQQWHLHGTVTQVFAFQQRLSFEIHTHISELILQLRVTIQSGTRVVKGEGQGLELYG